MNLPFGKAAIAAAGFAAFALATPASATFFSVKDGPAIGIGTACAALMEGVGRNPSVEADLVPIYEETVAAIMTGSYGSLKDVPQGVALCKAAQLDALARNPSVEDRLVELGAMCRDDLAALTSFRPDRAAVAIGEMCAALLDGGARNPGVRGNLLAAYIDGVEQIAALTPRSSDHVKAEGFGILKAAQIASVARQPGEAANLAEHAAICQNHIVRS